MVFQKIANDDSMSTNKTAQNVLLPVIFSIFSLDKFIEGKRKKNICREQFFYQINFFS